MGSIPAGGAKLKSRKALNLSGVSVFYCFTDNAQKCSHILLIEHQILIKAMVINLYCHILNMYFDEILYLAKNNVKLYVR